MKNGYTMRARWALLMLGLMGIVAGVAPRDAGAQARTGTEAGIAPDYQVRLKSRRFTPARLSRMASVPNARWHGLMQFDAVPSPSVVQSLRARGVQIEQRVAQTVVAASFPADFDPISLSGVRWAGRLAPQDKKSARLQAQVQPQVQSESVVEFFPDTTVGEVNDALLRVGARRLSSPTLPLYVAYTRLSQGQLDALAENDAVSWISGAPTALIEGKSVYYCPGAQTPLGPVANYVSEYATFSSGWDGPGQGSTSLLYHFTNSTPDLPVATQQNDLSRALFAWSKYAAVDWTYTNTQGAANAVDLSFGAIDGPYNTLAVTNSSTYTSNQRMADADIKFDENETWMSGGADIDLFSVALHEAGHALGMAHSDDPNSVMYAMYHRVTALQGDDINGIRAIYATRVPPADPTPPPTSTTNPIPNGAASSSGWSATDLSVGTDAKTRLLWNNTSTGQIALWILPSTGGLESNFNYGPYAGWSARSVAVGPDGKTRILWTRTNGEMSLWIVNASGAVENTPGFGPFDGWTARDVAVGPDSKSHILWTRTDGQVSLWNLSSTGAIESTPGFGPYPGWSATSLSVGGDNKTRIAWNNTDGQLSLWTIPVGGNIYEAYWNYGPYDAWITRDIAADNNGKTRVLWTRTDGQISLWTIGTSSAIETSPGFGPYGGWTANALTVGADLKTRVLWNNTDGQVSLWTVAATGERENVVTFGPY